MKRKLLFLGILGVLSFACTTLQSHSATALSGSEFRAENIIEDSLFYDGGNMSVNQIQDFLNSKVPSCDTWGNQIYSGSQTRAQYGASRGNPAPYKCLRDYTENTPARAAESSLCGNYAGGQKSGAQIIHDVAMVCGVSPKVLIILLQKEQTLITDDWPWPVQYRSATGYGCPDTAACDSEYYGFFNQVYNAARIYKKYDRDSSQYNYRAGRYNNIQYNPVASCGGKSVFIENQATAGLYIYTPYTPNQAALNNLYGSGDSCSAYGNRNFWRMYNDWFGSTYGALIRTENSGSLYVYDSGKRFSIPSMDLAAQYNFSARDVRFVSQGYMDSLPMGSSPLSSSIGQVVKSESDSDSDGGGLYLVSNGRRYPFASMSQFTDFGYSESSITYLPLSLILRIPQSPNSLSHFLQAPDGSLAKIESNKKRAILEIAKLQQANPSGNLSPLSHYTFNQWGYGQPLIDGSYAAIGPDGGVRLYASNGNYQSINSMDIYDCLGLNKLQSYRVKDYAIVNGNNLNTISRCVVKDASNQTYLFAYDKKFPLQSFSGSPAPFAVENDHAAKLTTAPVPSSSVKGDKSSTVGTIEDNQVRSFISADSFIKLGYNWGNILTLPQATIDSLPRGASKIAPGSILIGPDGSVSVVTGNISRAQIPSMNLFSHYSYNLAATYRVSQSVLDSYNVTGSLSQYIKTPDGVFLVDKGVRYFIDPSLDTALNINRAALQQVDRGVVTQTTMTWNMSAFIKATDSPKIYKLDNGTKRPFADWNVFMRESGNNPNVTVILSPEAVGRFPTGSTVN